MFEQTISIPELNDVVFEDGHVSVSIGTRASDGIQEFTNIPSPGPIGGFTYGVRYGIGRVIITVSSPSGTVPGAQVAKIVLTTADIGN
ncbi:hypothetical protein [Sphingobacterium populi]|uniref:hypothetical protein n=1 Tax=Sphingobacterium sp. CFCC 11742 TaxID=1775560 RepID=UPI00082EF845|nr:hypothetical protein [Sphingobacterium sp. CFCC 11742]